MRKKLEISHTRELEPGDDVVIRFSPGHLGFFRYGEKGVFQVSERSPEGGVRFMDRSGNAVGDWLQGTKEELLAKLRTFTGFSSFEVFRPEPGGEEEPLKLEAVAMGDDGIVPGPRLVLPPSFLIIVGVGLTLFGAWMYCKKAEEED